MSKNLVVLGNIENRRVKMMLQAWRQEVGGDATAVEWCAYLRDPTVLNLLESADVLKIESSGESWEVEKEMIAQGAGFDDVTLSEEEARLLEFEKGRIQNQYQWFRGWNYVMAELDGKLQSLANPVEVMNSPFVLKQLFDKYEWARNVGEPAKIAMPEKLGEVVSFDHFMDICGGRGKFFIKPRHSSSASGVLAVQVANGKIIAQGPVELCDGKLFNTLKLQKYIRVDEVRLIIDLLAKEKIFAERWVRKASIKGKVYDLRVVTTNGKVSHVVMRTSGGPITNLHLGNARGNLDELQTQLGDSWDGVEDLAERTAKCHPDALYLGIDVLVTQGMNQPMVIEVNAFGDLLPNVLNSAGKSTYEAQALFYAV